MLIIMIFFVSRNFSSLLMYIAVVKLFFKRKETYESKETS